MTVIVADLDKLDGQAPGRVDIAFVDYTVREMRESVGGDSIIVPVRVRVPVVDGVATSPSLEPGPAVVRISGDYRSYDIEIPESVSPILLWPLIDAATPPDNTAWMTGFVRNGGGVARIAAVEAAAYPSMVKDPNTFYILY